MQLKVKGNARHGVWCFPGKVRVLPNGDVERESWWTVWSERLPPPGRETFQSRQESELYLAAVGVGVDWSSPAVSGGTVTFPAVEL